LEATDLIAMYGEARLPLQPPICVSSGEAKAHPCCRGKRPQCCTDCLGSPCLAGIELRSASMHTMSELADAAAQDMEGGSRGVRQSSLGTSPRYDTSERSGGASWKAPGARCAKLNAKHWRLPSSLFGNLNDRALRTPVSASVDRRLPWRWSPTAALPLRAERTFFALCKAGGANNLSSSSETCRLVCCEE